MKNLKIILLLLLLSNLVFLTNCRKNNYETIKSEAIILFEGDPAIDGCGWFLIIDKRKYKPIELNNEFSIDSLCVSIEYNLLETKWACNWQTIEYEEIKIIKITKK